MALFLVGSVLGDHVFVSYLFNKSTSLKCLLIWGIGHSKCLSGSFEALRLYFKWWRNLLSQDLLSLCHFYQGVWQDTLNSTII